MNDLSFDLVWSRITRILSFFTGIGIMVYETIGDHSDRPWLYAAAVGLCGLPVARAAEGLLSKFATDGQPGDQPPDPPTKGGQ